MTGAIAERRAPNAERRDWTMPGLPTGTVTFLVSDVAHEALPPTERRALLERQNNVVGGAIVAHGGAQFRAEGATLFGAFPSAGPALAAALDVHRASDGLAADDALRRRLRLVLHTTETDVSAGRYLPSSLRRAARLLRAARGGQTLVGAATAEAIRRRLPPGLALHDLGDHLLADLAPAERIYHLVGSADPVDRRPIKSLDWHPHNLPPQLTPLIGRDAEQREAEHLLRRPPVRLVTLTGPGGIGKTRLALHVAAGLVDAFDDGVFFVSLAALADPSQVVPAIARMLDVAAPDAHDLGQALRTHLGERQLMLVLDNVEHVVDAAPEISGLLARCPAIKVLATSRESLNVQGEHDFPVPALGLPGGDAAASAKSVGAADAVRLFVARAKEANPRFRLTAEIAPVVAEICRRLDGLPLAIELAAASANVLTPPQLLERLDQRLPLPQTGRRDLPARHQTLRDTIAWSHDLLTTDEQILFRGLAVFAGTFDLDAAEWVTGDGSRVADEAELPSPVTRHPSPLPVLDGITALVSKSLVQPRSSPESGTLGPRFAMLRTIRDFALEQLEASGEAPDTRRRHAAWFLALAERADSELMGPSQADWLAHLDADLDDLRAALHWSMDQQDAETALRLGCALWRYWARRGFLREGQEWLGRALDLGGPATVSLRAKALNHLGNIANDLDDYARARALYEESLRLRRMRGDKPGVADILLNLGWVAFEQGRYSEALQLAEESRTMFSELKEETGVAYCLTVLAEIAVANGNFVSGEKYYQRIIETHRKYRNDVGVAYAELALGTIAGHQGEREKAHAEIDRALSRFREIGDRLGVAYALSSLAQVTMEEGKTSQAVILSAEALNLWQQTGRILGVIECLEGLARISASLGDHGSAARLAGWANAQRLALGTPLAPVREPVLTETIERVRNYLPPGNFEGARTAGEALTLSEALEIATNVVSKIDADGGPARHVDVQSGVVGLTARETEVLCEIAARKSNAEIAEALDISLRTVTTHVQNIFGKLNVNSRTSAAVLAIKHGLC